MGVARRLPYRERERLRHAVSQFGQAPFPLVLATGSFLPLLDNWLAHAVAAGVDRSLVLAVDNEAGRFRRPGCVVVQSDFRGAFADICTHRLRICAYLAQLGADFISSDLDAVWLSDPRPLCFGGSRLDLLFSQGTYHPEAAYSAWGFVVCGGFFAIRGGSASARFLSAALERAWPGSDDQAPINLTLLESGTRWDSDAKESYRLAFAGREMRCFRSVLEGTSERLGTRIGLIPHHLVPRAPVEETAAIVKHPGSPREPAAKVPVLRAAGCWRICEPQRPQMLIFTTHKSGTTLFHRLSHKLAERLSLRVTTIYGLVREIDPELDMVVLAHSLLGGRIERTYRAVRVVRDPRDVWVSGYLYHRRTEEGWCANSDLDFRAPIGWPQVDFSMVHRPERWKRTWLERLDGRSYRKNLLDRNTADGLAFELAGYTRCTLEAMRDFPLKSEQLLQIKLETIGSNFDVAMEGVFRHLGFGEHELPTVMEVARSEDVSRMDDAAVEADKHITARLLSKWRFFLSPDQVRLFEQDWGDLVEELGYERAAPADIHEEAVSRRMTGPLRSGDSAPLPHQTPRPYQADPKHLSCRP
jgi:Nucleotide-diphospho-sugar transferase